MIRPANRIAERVGAVGLRENLAVVESEVIRKIDRGYNLSNCGHELLVKQVLDVVYTLAIRIAYVAQVLQRHEEVGFRQRDDFGVFAEDFREVFAFFVQAARLLGQERVYENGRDFGGLVLAGGCCIRNS